MNDFEAVAGIPVSSKGPCSSVVDETAWPVSLGGSFQEDGWGRGTDFGNAGIEFKDPQKAQRP